MSFLRIMTDTETVDFTDGGQLALHDGAFEAPPPSVIERRSRANQNKIISRTWKNRIISFDYLVRESSSYSYSAIEIINKVGRLLNQASYGAQFNGIGTGKIGATHMPVKDTGDGSVHLYLELGDSKYSALTGEDGTALDDDRVLSCKIISGTQEVVGPFSINTQLDEGNDAGFVSRVRVKLECDPFFLGPSRVIETVSDPGLCQTPASEAQYTNNKIIVDGDDIPGDVPALTRISTAVTDALGIVMGRHAGTALVNCPTVPVFTGTGTDDLVVGGYLNSTTEKYYIIEILGVNISTGRDTYKISDDDGVTWNATHGEIFEHKTLYSPDDPTIHFTFYNETGHVIGDQWRFRTNQSYLLPSTGAIQCGIGQASTQAAAYTSEDGVAISTTYLNIPYEAAGKYKVMAQFEFTEAWHPEFKMVVQQRTSDSSYDWGHSSSSIFDWSRGFEPNEKSLIDLGTIDITPTGLPSRGHPGGHHILRLSFFARGQYLESSTYTIGCTRVMICPAQDSNSFLWAGWDFDGVGREVFCNYNYDNPYMAEVSANVVDVGADTIYAAMVDVELDDVRTLSLDGSYAGSMLTLYPGMDNTIVMSPVLTGVGGGNGNTDFRGSYFNTTSVAKTGAVSIAIRPRYIYLPGS